MTGYPQEVKAEERREIQLSAIDRLAEKVSPRWFAARLEAKQEAGFRRALLAYSTNHGYDAAIPTMERPLNYGILRSEEAELPGWDRFQLILETRNLYRNDPVIRAGVDGIARRIGIAHPHFQTSDAEWNAEAYRQWMDWCGDCDVRGIMTFDEIQEQVPKSCYTDGDLGLQFLDVDGDLRIDAKESDLIAAPMRTDINIDDVSPIGGIVWDIQTGRIKGYLVGRRGMGGLLQDTVEIPASEFLLLFRRQRRDQLRGVPLLAPVIDAAKDLHDYFNSTRIQARIAATFGVVIKKNAAAQYAQNLSQQACNDAGGFRKLPTYNGRAWVLQPDEDISMFKADVPGPLFDPYAKFQIRVIARGMKTTYEMLMSDYTSMSYSASKTNLMEENALVADWHRWKVRNMLRPTYSLWVAKRMESRLLPFNAEAYDGVVWPAPAKVGIDAQEDSAADIALIAAGLDDFESYFKRVHGDPNWRERLRRKAEQMGFINKLAKEEKCQPVEISSTLPPGIAPQTTDEPNKDKAPVTAGKDEEDD